MILSDSLIRELCVGVQDPLIWPFSEPVGKPCISYGVTSAGYDLRLDRKVLVFKPTYCEVIDPKQFGDPEYRARVFDEYEAEDHVLVPPHSYILVQSKEKFHLPPWLKGRCVGKSTYARCGIIVNTTPLEPGWRGYLTIEIANTAPLPTKLYVGEGIAQVEFEEVSGEVHTDYAAKGGKYQDQTTVTPAR